MNLNCIGFGNMSKWKSKPVNVQGCLTAEMLEEVSKLAFNSFGSTKTIFEMHADGVKEVIEECPFCEEPCEEPHCPYTEEE